MTGETPRSRPAGQGGQHPREKVPPQVPEQQQHRDRDRRADGHVGPEGEAAEQAEGERGGRQGAPFAVPAQQGQRRDEDGRHEDEDDRVVGPRLPRQLHQVVDRDEEQRGRHQGVVHAEEPVGQPDGAEQEERTDDPGEEPEGQGRRPEEFEHRGEDVRAGGAHPGLPRVEDRPPPLQDVHRLQRGGRGGEPPERQRVGGEEAIQHPQQEQQRQQDRLCPRFHRASRVAKCASSRRRRSTTKARSSWTFPGHVSPGVFGQRR